MILKYTNGLYKLFYIYNILSIQIIYAYYRRSILNYKLYTHTRTRISNQTAAMDVLFVVRTYTVTVYEKKLTHLKWNQNVILHNKDKDL